MTGVWQVWLLAIARMLAVGIHCKNVFDFAFSDKP